MADGPQPVYRRILLKMSGEALMGDGAYAIDPKVIDRLAKEVRHIYDLGVQVAIVVGGGNFFRGATLSEAGISRITADHMGMLATTMNALAVRDLFEKAGLPTRILSAVPLGGLVDLFGRRDAIHHLDQGRVVLFAAGTGNPLVTTDSAASLRGIEIEADIVLKATNVDGVYSADPSKNPDAVKYDRVTFSEALAKELKVMDLSAFCQCRDHNMPLRIFDIKKPDALLNIVLGKNEGTLVERG